MVGGSLAKKPRTKKIVSNRTLCLMNYLLCKCSRLKMRFIYLIITYTYYRFSTFVGKWGYKEWVLVEVMRFKEWMLVEVMGFEE